MKEHRELFSAHLGKAFINKNNMSVFRSDVEDAEAEFKRLVKSEPLRIEWTKGVGKNYEYCVDALCKLTHNLKTCKIDLAGDDDIDSTQFDTFNEVMCHLNSLKVLSITFDPLLMDQDKIEGPYTIFARMLCGYVTRVVDKVKLRQATIFEDLSLKGLGNECAFLVSIFECFKENHSDFQPMRILQSDYAKAVKDIGNHICHLGEEVKVIFDMRSKQSLQEMTAIDTNKLNNYFCVAETLENEKRLAQNIGITDKKLMYSKQHLEENIKEFVNTIVFMLGKEFETVKKGESSSDINVLLEQGDKIATILAPF